MLVGAIPLKDVSLFKKDRTPAYLVSIVVSD